MVRTPRTAVAAIAIFVLVAGCATSTPSVPSTAPSPATAAPGSRATPSAVASAEASPMDQPTAVVSARPDPTASPAPAAAWSRPRLVRGGNCQGVAAAIDEAGRYHLAAQCRGRIIYLTSDDGISWSETAFAPPTGRSEIGPQLAIDGDTLHLAFTRYVEPDGTGCGDGVYARTRRLPDGAWSTPVRVGPVGDCLESFRAVDGVLHLAVSTDDGGPVYYESQSGGTLTRIRIPRAWDASVRVGDDDHARIAYATVRGIRYARVDDGRLSITGVASPKGSYAFSPSLVLGPGDEAFAMWYQWVDIGDDIGPLDGTYFGSDRSGRWRTIRLSRAFGESRYAFTIDPATDRIHAVIADGALTYFTSPTGRKWTRKKLPGTKDLESPVVRLDRGSGRLVVFAIRPKKGIYLLSKP